jgi:post-segregation antitoxin (ccd killing protein)
MSRKKTARDDIPVSFRLPADLQKILIEKARREDLNFSQLVRRALRREFTEAGIPLQTDA